MSWHNYTLEADTQKARKARADVATQAQMAAMRPQGSVQVAAAAGTGKTHVLTRRFLRLLLEDGHLRPSEILAVTYTKAGATEMRNRLTEILARWAVMPENELSKTLTEILERTPAANTLSRARALFTDVLDDPVGIRVLTVHSFCQSLLAQFPLEAGINAGFRILEGREAEALLQEKVAQTYTHMADWTPDQSPYWWAFSWMVTHLADASLQSEFKDYVENRRRYERLFQNGGGLEGVLADLAEALDIPLPDAPPDKILAEVESRQLADLENHRGFLKAFAEALAEDKGVVAQGNKDRLNSFLAATSQEEKHERLPELYAVFETTKGAKRAKIVPAGVAKAWPGMPDEADGFYCVLEGHKETLNKYKTYFKTASYLVMAHEIGQRYAEAKHSQGMLDFEDLIRHSKNLLTGDAGKAAWVRFKMDGHIRHIMLDEAQDTDSDQWDIVRALIDDFFTGQGQHEGQNMEGALNRTFFAVGDGKQAIYRFRGAERHVFEGMLPEISQMAAPAGHQVRFVDLNTSFRSSNVILDFVDSVFSTPENRHAIDGQTEPLKHEAFHLGAGGRVEILPPEPAQKPDRSTVYSWQLPLPDRRTDGEETPRMRLFNRLATRLKTLIEQQPFLATEGRFLVPSDIMVLCRTSGHMELFLNALATTGVTASKTGDLELAQAPAVTDLMAVLRFLANPTDDLSLLHALRSPLFGLTNAELEQLRQRHASGRSPTYFKTLCRMPDAGFAAMASTLKNLLNQVDLATPHQLLQKTLGTSQGRGNLLWRYTGATDSAAAETINQALDSFLDAALDYSSKEGTSLIGFLHWFDQGGLRIKIEAGANKNAVQVMTAHASKGLQAPVVVLPETGTSFYSQSKTDHKLWRVDGETHQDDLFLFGASEQHRTSLQSALMKAEKQRVFDDEMRLLYVALTRAQEHLIIAATAPAKEDNWYTLMTEQIQADGENPAWQKHPDGTLLYQEKHLFTDAPVKPDATPEPENEAPPLPAWVQTRPEAEHRAENILAGENPGENPGENRAAQLMEGETRQKYRRGLLLHRLLEVLPGLPDDNTRRQKGRNFLAYSGTDFCSEKREQLLADALAVIASHPELFGEGYRPEATLAMADKQGRRLKGRVDCLRLTPDTVYITDYKTDVTPPETVPAAYRKQLQAYAAMARSIWPDRAVKTAILWTTPTPPRLDRVENEPVNGESGI